MQSIVLGNTKELIIFSDLMKKAGSDVQVYPSPTRSDIDQTVLIPDVIAFSSETLSAELQEILLGTANRNDVLLCDITDGADRLASDAGALPEYALQAATGLAHTTGFPDAGPTVTNVPFIAFSCALYAASIICAVLNRNHKQSSKPTVQASRYLTAINALTTFLPAALQGANPARIGNQHPSSSPWNTYPTQDGWVLICTSKDAQWAKLRDAIGSDAVRDPQFDAHATRIEKRALLDQLIAAWTSQQPTDACVQDLLDAGIPAGPILSADTVFDDPNMKKRQAELNVHVDETLSVADQMQRISLFRKTTLSPSETPSPTRQTRAQTTPDKPLAGLRVIELGQFTTAPLACRHLANLGADVLKIEAPGGEPARHWKPIIDGQGHFFTITNTGKSFKELNLRDPAQLDILRDEIRRADIIVENMRPDVMGKLGLGLADLSALNPNLIVCSVSGFGAYSAYPGRAAYDTIVQGMSGMMDLTRSNGQPTKLGISAADILGAQVALFAILSSLNDTGHFIDISMQDVAAYATILGKQQTLSKADSQRVLKNTRTVFEIAQSEGFARQVLTTVPDQNGQARLAPRLPYSVT